MEEGGRVIGSVLELESAPSLDRSQHTEDTDDERAVHLHVPDEEGAKLITALLQDLIGPSSHKEGTQLLRS